MIVIIGSIEFAPEHTSAMHAAIATVVEATLAETGCEIYRFTADLTRPGVVHVVEEWADEAAVAAHMTADHFRQFGRTIRGFGVTATTFDRYEATAKSSLF